MITEVLRALPAALAAMVGLWLIWYVYNNPPIDPDSGWSVA